jgi:hypothetical protein
VHPQATHAKRPEHFSRTTTAAEERHGASDGCNSCGRNVGVGSFVGLLSQLLLGLPAVFSKSRCFSPKLSFCQSPPKLRCARAREREGKRCADARAQVLSNGLRLERGARSAAAKLVPTTTTTTTTTTSKAHCTVVKRSNSGWRSLTHAFHASKSKSLMPACSRPRSR